MTLKLLSEWYRSADISTHTLTWSVTHVHAPYSPVAPISTHTLTWSVTSSLLISGLPVIQFQLTRSRGAWRTRRNNRNKRKGISTHTLTWSVTTFFIIWIHCIHISTHTLTWSVTLNRRFWQIDMNISTHTLTWSVTYICGQSGTGKTFQLTRSRGAWLLWLSQYVL